MTTQNQTWPVVEVFGPTLQGEGILTGERTMFVRFGYCDGVGLSGWCTWCDSMEAVDPVHKANWRQLNSTQICAALHRLRTTSRGFIPCSNITLTGGNPAIHDLTRLVEYLRTDGYSINVETQATIWRPWLADVDLLTISPKPPSAGTYNPAKLANFIEQLHNTMTDFNSPVTILKIVVDVDNPKDYYFAKSLTRKYGGSVDGVVFSLMTHTDEHHPDPERLRRLAEKVCHDPDLPDVKVLFQYHKLLWGQVKGV